MSGRLAVFKCAFGGTDGWGHVTRSGALAGAFTEAGWRTVLWTRSDASALTRETAESFDDVAQVVEIPAAARDAAVVVVDEMYTLDTEFAALRASWPGSAIFVGIDDMQRRSMSAFDLVVNTEIGLREARYLAPHRLLGERYALLRKGFREPEPSIDFFPPEGVTPVFVMLGGTDAFAYTRRALDSLASIDPRRFAPVVALGAAGDKRGGIVELLGQFPFFRLLERAESAQIASWMRRCSFGVIACGTSLYEAAAMGLPFVGLSLVDNQSATARKVAEQWRMPVLHREDRHEERLDLGACVEEALRRRIALSGAAYAEVDALGARRVVEQVVAFI